MSFTRAAPSSWQWAARTGSDCGRHRKNVLDASAHFGNHLPCQPTDGSDAKERGMTTETPARTRLIDLRPDTGPGGPAKTAAATGATVDGGIPQLRPGRRHGRRAARPTRIPQGRSIAQDALCGQGRGVHPPPTAPGRRVKPVQPPNKPDESRERPDCPGPWRSPEHRHSTIVALQRH